MFSPVLPVRPDADHSPIGHASPDAPDRVAVTLDRGIGDPCPWPPYGLASRDDDGDQACDHADDHADHRDRDHANAGDHGHDDAAAGAGAGRAGPR